MDPPRRLNPPPNRRLCLTTWIEGVISLGRDRYDFYQYLIVHDLKQATAFLPFEFTTEPLFGENVIKVHKYREGLQKHRKELGLELAYVTGCIISELVIVSVSDNTLPTANSPETSTAPPAYEPPSQDSPASPLPYDFKNHPIKYDDSKGKEI